MSDIIENFNIIKNIYSYKPNSKRNIIGLYSNNLQPYNPSGDPFKKIIRTEPINDQTKKAKENCEDKWKECTNFNICNNMLALKQDFLYKNLNLNSDQLSFYNDNKNDKKFIELKNCIVPILYEEDSKLKKIISEEEEKINVIQEETVKKETIKPLFNNADEFYKIFTDNKYKIIKFTDDNQLNIINNTLDGIIDIKISTGWDTNTVFTIEGGEFNGRKFYNIKNYVPLYNNQSEILNPKNIYHLSTKLEINDELLSLYELFDKGMTNFNLVNINLTDKIWDINTEFVIIGGEYNGVVFKNRISDIISRNLPCHLIYKVPFIGKILCAERDNSTYIIAGILLVIIIIIALFFFLGSKEPKLTPEQFKQKILQVKYP